MKKPFSYLIVLSILCIATNFHASVFINSDDTSNKTVESDSTEWRQLFNGKDLTGWKHVGNGHMTVEDGIIQTHGGMGLLYWIGEKFGNCTIRVVYRHGNFTTFFCRRFAPLAITEKPL